MHRKDKCSIRTQTEEEDVVMEEKAETIENRHMNITSTIGKTSETLEERSTGRGAC